MTIPRAPRLQGAAAACSTVWWMCDHYGLPISPCCRQALELPRCRFCAPRLQMGRGWPCFTVLRAPEPECQRRPLGPSSAMEPCLNASPNRVLLGSADLTQSAVPTRPTSSAPPAPATRHFLWSESGVWCDPICFLRHRGLLSDRCCLVSPPNTVCCNASFPHGESMFWVRSCLCEPLNAAFLWVRRSLWELFDAVEAVN